MGNSSMTDRVKLDAAEKDVAELYNNLVDVATGVAAEKTAAIDAIVKELSKGINLFSNADLWDFQLRLGVEAFILSAAKEQSALKQACADAVYKEALAKSYSIATGAQEAKKQQSILETVDKQAVNMVWTAVSNILKTKLDEAHRLVNIIQSIQISRAAEAKQASSPRSEPDRMTLME